MYVLGRITQKLWTKFDKIIAVYCIWDQKYLNFELMAWMLDPGNHGQESIFDRFPSKFPGNFMMGKCD